MGLGRQFQAKQSGPLLKGEHVNYSIKLKCNGIADHPSLFERFPRGAFFKSFTGFKITARRQPQPATRLMRPPTKKNLVSPKSHATNDNARILVMSYPTRRANVAITSLFVDPTSVN